MRLIDYKKKYELSKSEKDEKEYFLNCYKVFFACDSYKGELEDRSIYEGVSIKEILKGTKIVLIYYMNLSEEDYYYTINLRNLNLESKEKRIVKDTTTNKLLVSLLGENNEDKICSLISECGLKPNYIKGKISAFVNKYYYDKLFLEQVLKSKINLYLAKCSLERKKEKKEMFLENNKIIYEKSREVIEEFLKSNYLNINDYCGEKGISVDYFNICVSIVGELDSNFYETYLNVLESKRKIDDSLIRYKLNLLLYYLVDGKDAFKKEFDREIDLIDYYQFIGLDVDTLYKVLDRLNYSSTELKLLKKLVFKEVVPAREKHIPTEKEVINIVLQGIKEIGCKQDKKGNLIPGTGRIIDIGEKEQIINFLQYYNIPINLKNYRIAFDRYIDGTLFIEEDKVSKFLKQRKLES